MSASYGDGGRDGDGIEMEMAMEMHMQMEMVIFKAPEASCELTLA